MPRLRQVRYSYPCELLQLAILLSERHEKRDVSATLGIPTSTLYRWLEIHRRRSLVEREKVYSSQASQLRELVSACEAHGFSVKERVEFLTSSLARDERAGVFLQDRQPRRDNVVYFNSGACAEAHDPTVLAMTKLAANNIVKDVSIDICSRLQAVRDKIDSEYFTELSCSEFGRIARMSKFNLINRFTAQYGVSPYRYLLTVRIQHAKKLLSSMQEPLDTIATVVGFDSQSSLCRSFKSVEGVSLSEFYRGLRVSSTASNRLLVSTTQINEHLRIHPDLSMRSQQEIR